MGQVPHAGQAAQRGKGSCNFRREASKEVGGVLEHPVGSSLWKRAGLPAPGKRDRFGGFTLGVNQHWWGHRAEKATLLYICGCEPRDIPHVPLRLEYPTHVIGDVGRAGKGTKRPEVSKEEREHTPPDFAAWLIELAKRCHLR